MASQQQIGTTDVVDLVYLTMIEVEMLELPHNFGMLGYHSLASGLRLVGPKLVEAPESGSGIE